MGKSSLMIPHRRAALAAEGRVPVIIDLTEFGRADHGGAVVQGLPARACRISSAAHERVGRGGTRTVRITPSRHRFTVTSAKSRSSSASERLVMFVDEIDTTLRLDFTDDFFAAIRFLYQHRAATPSWSGSRSC